MGVPSLGDSTSLGVNHLAPGVRVAQPSLLHEVLCPSVMALGNPENIRVEDVWLADPKTLIGRWQNSRQNGPS